MSTPLKAPARMTLREALADWTRTDGRAWIYMLKTYSAAMLALLIAMRLDLVEPRTAMTTVFIVMQPLSGMVLAKSFYRMLGQIGGLTAMMVFIALFAQQPALYLPAIALWVGFCTAGAARNRNFQWYGFVLCGYTAALIGIPAGQQPDGAFYAATTRLAEVSIGILCAGTISVLVFPQYAGEQLRRAVRQRYSVFAKFVASVLAGKVDRAGFGAVNAGFITDIVGLEASRSVAIFESPEMRLRSGRVARLNNEFMSASTRLNMLHQLLGRIDAQGQREVHSALEPYLREIAPLLDPAGKPVIDSRTAVHAAAGLEQFGATLHTRLAATRMSFRERLMSSDAASLLLEFDTTVALLLRFVDDLREYTHTYASLSATSHDREKGAARFVPETSGLLALVSGIRASLVVLILSAFWIATAWPSGGTAVLAAAAIVARISSAPRPTLRSFQIAVGSAFAALAGFFAVFFVYPRIDGFPMLCVGLFPFLMAGAYMTTRPRLSGYGVGYSIFFCFLAGPDNAIEYDPSRYLNDGVALVIGLFFVATAYAVFLPADAPWQRKLLLWEMRREFGTACCEKLHGLGSRFDSRVRDLWAQINASADEDAQMKSHTLSWLFAVLGIGRAVIDIRHEADKLPAAQRRLIDSVISRLATLFRRPGKSRFQDALAAVRYALDDLDAFNAGNAPAATEEPVAHDDSRNSAERVRLSIQLARGDLQLIRSALLDPTAPFTRWVGLSANASDTPSIRGD